jgi:hypothetical protein
VFSEPEPAVLKKDFKEPPPHCYLPSSQLCHVSIAVSEFEVGEREIWKAEEGPEQH